MNLALKATIHAERALKASSAHRAVSTHSARRTTRLSRPHSVGREQNLWGIRRERCCVIAKLTMEKGDPTPDHFEGNIGANIAGGRYPDAAVLGCSTCDNFRGTGHEWTLVSICMVCRAVHWTDSGCLDCKKREGPSDIVPLYDADLNPINPEAALDA
jgi:hypothetical protein